MKKNWKNKTNKKKSWNEKINKKNKQPETEVKNKKEEYMNMYSYIRPNRKVTSKLAKYLQAN